MRTQQKNRLNSKIPSNTPGAASAKLIFTSNGEGHEKTAAPVSPSFHSTEDPFTQNRLWDANETKCAVQTQGQLSPAGAEDRKECYCL
ncbi:hypothetical protein CEXT_719641 [Caerostris extrusa]|uniref:Uncharacterized protein n=1 Tax=Caerostris extrusa TaxID=172846 RepID=A0AAV4VZF5_CAEEX|nr:hypothetical protein CEXT_719641 [Caerostris extrusa]